MLGVDDDAALVSHVIAEPNLENKQTWMSWKGCFTTFCINWLIKKKKPKGLDEVSTSHCDSLTKNVPLHVYLGITFNKTLTMPATYVEARRVS